MNNKLSKKNGVITAEGHDASFVYRMCLIA